MTSEVDDSTKYSCSLNSNRWSKAMLYLLLTYCVLVLVFFDTLASIVRIWWQTGTYTHGFLIVPIVMFLVWRKREEIALIPPVPQVKILIVVGLLLLVWFVAYILNIVILMQLSVVALIPCFAWLLLGKNVVSTLAFPIGFLFFAVPFGDVLIPTLQDITALLAVKALQLSSIPVYLEGRYFYIPTGSFEVEEGCSGVRYLIASLCLGTLYAYLYYYSIKRRLIFIAFCGILPIVANAVRAYGIVMLAHLSDYKIAVGVDHIIYGWLFFGVVILFVFWVGVKFKDSPGLVVNKKEKLYNDLSLTSINYAPLSIVVILLMVSTSLAAKMEFSAEKNISSVALKFPKGKSDWDGPYETQKKWNPQFLGAAFEKTVQYKNKTKDVEVYIGYFSQQRQGAELISANNRFFDDTKWKRLKEANTKMTLANGYSWEVNEILISSRGNKRILWYWYDVGGYYTTNSIMAKIMELPLRLFNKNKGSAVFIISTTYEFQIESSRKNLQGFLANMLSPMLDMTG